MPKTFTISDLAKEFGITTRSIRHYEDQQLLLPRRNGLQRIYSQGDRVRLQLILRGKRIGFSLAQIKEILDLYNAPEGRRKQTERLMQMINDRRDALLQQRSDIRIMLEELQRIEDKLGS